jgi:hypothetical protein
MSTCTWRGCTAEAAHKELDRDGKPWAHLCQNHHEILDLACEEGDAKKFMAAWALAQPQERIVERVMPRTERGRRLLALRQRIVASGTKLLTLEEVNRERTPS